jgi:hypothetical protein
MNKCDWEAIDGFSGPSEYQRFCAWIADQISAGLTEEIDVDVPSSDLPFGLDEKWFKCRRTNEVWRLVAPEPPFRGTWEPITFQGSERTASS